MVARRCEVRLLATTCLGAQDHRVSQRDVSAGRSWVAVVTVLWMGTALASAGPGLLLLGFAETRLAWTAALALLFAGVVAAGSAVACTQGLTRPLLVASAAVVLLCSAAQVLLRVDARVTPGGFVLLGGAAAALAVLAGMMTMRATRRGRSR